jgi:hypothetical protein
VKPTEKDIDAVPRAGFAFSATHATIVVAVIGAIATGAGAVFTAWQNVKVESAKQDAAAKLAQQEFETKAKLARKEFETKLIFRAIEGSDSVEERVRNLKFFLDAGFLSDDGDKIRNLDPAQYPSVGSPSFECVKTDAAGHVVCGDPALSAKDRIMATLYRELRKMIEPQAGKQVLEEQLTWLAERNECTKLGPKAASCMMEKYELRITHLQGQIALHHSVARGGSKVD